MGTKNHSSLNGNRDEKNVSSLDQNISAPCAPQLWLQLFQPQGQPSSCGTEQKCRDMQHPTPKVFLKTTGVLGGFGYLLDYLLGFLVPTLQLLSKTWVEDSSANLVTPSQSPTFFQRLSIAVQRGNAISILGTSPKSLNAIV